MIIRAILPAWAVQEYPELPKVVEGDFTSSKIQDLNAQQYNIYYFPNSPEKYNPQHPVSGTDITQFNYVFVDMDLKDGAYATVDDFISVIATFSLQPTSIVSSGNGAHVYWRVSDLDPMSYLRLQRRLTRHFNTDEAVGKICQLMRFPGSINTKSKNEPKLAELLFQNEINVYTSEQLAAVLPMLTPEDELFCTRHYDSIYNPDKANLILDDKLPLKFAQLLRANTEVKSLYVESSSDRSKADYRLGHIMFGNGFTKEEALSVLVNTAKAITRSPTHRINYAQNIIDKIWTFEEATQSSDLNLSETVKDILSKSGTALDGTRFPCHRWIDATETGFRLGHVVGLVAGSGVGKTAIALNMFKGFVQNNPDYVHFFIPLEQKKEEIASRWKTMCGTDDRLHDKVNIISNYDQSGNFRHLSLVDIEEYIVKYQQVTGKKVGAIVIDHIGALKKKGKNGENQDLMDICHSMKSFAIRTNTLLVMQSQAPREKAGIGDLELNKDAAYGTVYFESYCDFLITVWQPLKRCYTELACPTVTAFKFCKIRHKKQHLDEIKEDTCYKMFFDPNTEQLREMTQLEDKAFQYWLSQATNKRKQDRKTDLVEYTSITWDIHGKTDNITNAS